MVDIFDSYRKSGNGNIKQISCGIFQLSTRRVVQANNRSTRVSLYSDVFTFLLTMYYGVKNGQKEGKVIGF